MADRRWDALTEDTPQDADIVALQRANDNFKWTFQGLRTWLGGFFEALGAVSTHNADANAHVGTFEPSGSVSAHNADANAHTGTFESAGAVATHNTDSAAHGGVEAGFAAHDGAAGGHPTFTSGALGFAPASGGGSTNYLRADGTWAEPPGSASVTNPPSAKGQLWTHDGTGNVVLPVGANGLVLEADATTSTGLKWGTKTGAGGGDVTGPASSNDSSLASFDGTTGKVIKDSGISQGSVSGHIGDSSIHFTVGSINHNSVSGRSTADAHPTSAITGLDTALAGKLDTTHATDPNAHSTEIAGAISTHDGDAAAHGGVEAAFAAHQGSGGTEHANATGATAGFLSAADKTKLDGIATGAEVNAVDSVFGRTGAVTASSGDYTASQVTNALGTNVSSTMSSASGHAATTRTVTAGGSFTPNPLQGQFVSFSGTSATTIETMAQNGFMVIEVSEALAANITLAAGWNNETSPKVGRASILQLARVGATLTAEWA